LCLKSQIPSTKKQTSSKLQAPYSKEIPNYKHQITNKSQLSSIKFQINHKFQVSRQKDGGQANSKQGLKLFFYSLLGSNTPQLAALKG
jgi:hypothetical protein